MNSAFYYTFNGFIVHDLSEVPENAIVQTNVRLLGGKGGFGSMLRAIGSQIEKTTNKEMCRDLNGRRMRDVNYEKKLKEWLDKTDERKRKKIEEYLERRRKRKHLLENGPSTDLRSVNKLSQECQETIAQELQSAIEEAFSKLEKKDSDKPSTTKRRVIDLGVDSDVDSISSSSDDSAGNDENVIDVNKQHKSKEESEPETKKVKLDIPNISQTGIDQVHTKNNENNSITKDSYFSQTVINEIETKNNEVNSNINISNTNQSKEPIKQEEHTIEFDDINLDNIGSVDMLLTLGLDHIKHELLRRGLKLGGTLMERVQRLFSVKGLQPNQYPSNILVGSVSNGNKRKRNKK